MITFSITFRLHFNNNYYLHVDYIIKLLKHIAEL